AVKIIGKSRKAINLALPELIQAAKDSDGFVRSEAVRALGKSGGQVSKVMPVLIQALAAESFTRAEAVYALTSLGPAAADAIPTLVKTFREVDDFILQGHILKALAKIGPKSVPFFEQLLKDDKYLDRSTVIYAIADMGRGASELVPVLVDL